MRRGQYDDIINLPHHESASRPRMPIQNRAAQFMPFAVLTGYDDAIEETARLTDEKINLDEYMKAKLDKKLKILQKQIKNEPEITIIYFQHDKLKTGGAYVSVNGVVKKIDYYKRTIVMQDETEIAIDDIINITGDIVKFCE